MKPFRNLSILLCAVALSACSAIPDGAFANRIAVTVSGDEAVALHNWGVFSIGSKLDRRDAEALWNLMHPPVPAVPVVVQATK